MKNLLLVILCVLIAAVIIGCSETEDPVTTEFTADDATFGTVGEMKTTMDAAPAAPSVPTDGTPFVKSVGYYSDWQLTEQLADGAEVPVGTLVYIHIQFSEPMAHRNTDNEEQKVARPILYYWVNSELIRFRVMPHGSQGDDFVSGDAKPKGGGTDDYVCKYRVVKEHEGSQFWVRVGKWSVDIEGNTLADSYTHKEKLRLGERESRETQPKQPEPTVVEEKKEPKPSEKEEPEPIEVSYYTDRNFTEPIDNLEDGIYAEISPGDTVYTKVVFSGTVPVVVADDGTAKPAIFYRVEGIDRQYHINASNENLKSGDAKIHKNTGNIVICKYVVRQNDAGLFVTFAGDGEFFGDHLKIKRKQPVIPVPMPEPVIPVPDPEPIVPVPMPQPTTAPVGNLDFYIHGDGTTDRPTEYRGVTPGPEDFGGYVLIPKKIRPSGFGRSHAQPIAGVTVTITAGPHAEKRVVTDENGQYLFKGVREDTLRLRVEGEHLETKEVVAYRSRPTTLEDGTTSIHSGDPQNVPGNILIGQRWPDAVRPMLQQVRGASDPLFIITSPSEKWGGSYTMGVVVIYENLFDYGEAHVIQALTHEIAHMWQHVAIRNAPIRNDSRSWTDTPEGVSFVEAREKDWDDVGKARIDYIPGFSSHYENAAETCAYYWTGESRGFYGDLSVTTPNRFRWVQRWFGK